MDEFFKNIDRAFSVIKHEEDAGARYALAAKGSACARIQQILPYLITAAELLKKDLPARKWLVEGLVPVGLTEIAGRPKAGKSVLALMIAIAIVSGRKLLGKFVTHACKVFYLSYEDDEIEWQEKLKLIPEDQANSDDLIIGRSWPTLKNGGLEALDQYLTAAPSIKLVVIDTLARFTDASVKKTYAAEYMIMAKLQDMAKNHDAAIITIHHATGSGRKGALKSVYGTAGITAAADSVITVAREEQNKSGKLHAIGRGYKDFTLDLIMTEAGWVLPNVNPVDSLTKEQLRVYEVVAGAAGKFITTAEIARAVGKTEPATINILNRLITLGLIIRVKTGTYALAGATTSATGKGSSQEMQVNNQIGQGMPQ